MDASSRMVGHMINFFYGFLETRGVSTNPVSHLTVLSTVKAWFKHNALPALKLN